jgi:hypothetical protein
MIQPASRGNIASKSLSVVDSTCEAHTHRQKSSNDMRQIMIRVRWSQDECRTTGVNVKTRALMIFDSTQE